MKPSEFYENYWKIDCGNGVLKSPPKLSDAEKEFLDNAAARPSSQGVLFMRKRKRTVQVNIEALKRDLNKLPEYFIPHQQPKLDEYGSILSDTENKPQQP